MPIQNAPPFVSVSRLSIIAHDLHVDFVHPVWTLVGVEEGGSELPVTPRVG